MTPSSMDFSERYESCRIPDAESDYYPLNTGSIKILVTSEGVHRWVAQSMNAGVNRILQQEKNKLGIV